MIINKNGIITHVPLEGGFFGIISNDGQKYNPQNLPSEYKKDGLKVIFEARILDDVINLQMWGQDVEIITIKVEDS